MTENKTEALKQKLEEEKAEKEAQRLKEEQFKAEQPEETKKWIMPVWLPYLAAAVVAFLVALFTRNTMMNTIIAIAIGVVAFFIMDRIRAKTLSDAGVRSAEDFSSEIAGKLYELRDLIIDRAKGIKKAEIRESLGNIAGTLNKIADEVEHDPKDRKQGKKTGQLLRRHASWARGQVYQTSG